MFDHRKICIGLQDIINEIDHTREVGKIARAALERVQSIVYFYKVGDFESYDQACQKLEKSGQDQWFAVGYKEGVRTRDEESELERFGSICERSG